MPVSACCPRRHPGESPAYPLPSFQRKLESSGLYNPFPQSGNDNRGAMPAGGNSNPSRACLSYFRRACLSLFCAPARRKERGVVLLYRRLTPPPGRKTARPFGFGPDRRAGITPRLNPLPSLKRLIQRGHPAQIPVPIPRDRLAIQIQKQTGQQLKLRLGPEVKTAA